MTQQDPAVEVEYERKGRPNPWPLVVMVVAALLTLATCYLGKVQGLPWQ